MRHLHENAGAVAGVSLTAACPAVLEVFQNLERFGNDVVRLARREIGDEADAARIVLVPRIVQPLFGRIHCTRHERIPEVWGGRASEQRYLTALPLERWLLPLARRRPTDPFAALLSGG